jgi:hypothetical protein
MFELGIITSYYIKLVTFYYFIDTLSVSIKSGLGFTTVKSIY